MTVASDTLYLLIAEPDDDRFERLRELLDGLGEMRVHVKRARDFDEALGQARTVQHDLHLVADPLQGRSAPDWLREAQSLGVTGPVIVVGAERHDAIEQDAIAAGAADYLALPGLRADDLARSVRDALRRARWRSEITLGLTQYQALFASAPIPMWVYDLETLRFLAVNEAAVAHYGYTEAQFMRMTLMDIRTTEDRQRVIEAVRRLPSGLNRSGPWRHVRRDGSVIDVLISSDDIRFNGRPARFTVIYDVTLQLRAERLMRDSVRQLRQVLADVGDALLVVGADGRVRLANAAAGALWQVPPDHLEGHRLPLEIDCDRGETELVRRDGRRRLLDVRRAQTTWAGEQAHVLTLRDLRPDAIELELTESALMENVERVLGTLKALKTIGVRLTLDDFGTGYSSLNYLRRLPIDKLKIDRSFLAEVSSGSRDAAIARALIAMGHQLQLQVLAEGVENEDQLGYLRRNHCDQFQGNLLSGAVAADDVERLLRQRYLRPESFEATRPDRVLLVVDDEENVLRSLVRLFRRDGYRVLTAGNADEAFALLARNHVQVILSDQRMPGTSGTEFLGKVKDLYPDTVRLVLSGYTDLATVTEAINRGAIYRFLTKPWNESELREHIREAFRKHEEAALANAG